MKDRRASVALAIATIALGVGCGATGETTPSEQSPPVEHAERAPTEGAPSEQAPTEPAAPEHAPSEPAAAEVVTPPRLEVPAPADLAAALGARRPTIEIVPQSCGVSLEPVATTDERVCLQDTSTGLTRAMRRFATSELDAVDAARHGDDVVFAVLNDDSGAITRYSGRIWRWDLQQDSYLGLVGRASESYSTPQVVGADFGLILSDSEREVDWVYAAGELERIRGLDHAVGGAVVIGGHTYLREARGNRETLFLVRREGPRVLFDRLASYPIATHLPLLVAFPEDRALVVSAFPRGDTTRLHIVEPPAVDVRELEVPLAQPRGARLVDGALELRTREARFLVDLTTGAVTPSTAPPPETTAAPRQPHSGSLYAVVATAGGLVLSASGRTVLLGPEGVRALEGDAPSPGRSPCRCVDDALVCGDAAPIAAACTSVEELERLSAEGGEEVDYGRRLQAPTSYAPDGSYRVDRLEPDLVRVTRLSDGARLWARVTDGGVLAQADDGAFSFAEEASLEGYALRWGRSLIDAPVTALARHREAFFRPTLVADFFSARPLPAAVTTLPQPLPEGS